MLKTDVAELLTVAAAASSMYRRARKHRKPDGSMRETFDAHRHLKAIQARIQCLILRKVVFPRYLQGCIQDPIERRGQTGNARQHVRRRSIISMDVENFFPNTSGGVIGSVWAEFFRCPPDVALCLTQLTSKDDALPQGAKTSPLIANLIFWRNEPDLVAHLGALGVRYTRLVDDVTCSFGHDPSRDEISHVIEQVNAMLCRLGYRSKRAKQTISHAGQRLSATKLVVNNKVGLPSEKRALIRAEVSAFVNNSATSVSDNGYHRVAGRVGYLSQHHKKQAYNLRRVLQAARSVKLGDATT